MIRTISDFVHLWSRELESTQKILKHLTDRSLAQEVAPEGRTLGRLAWHIVTTYAEMMAQTGLKFTSVSKDAPVPSKAADIQKAYAAVTKEMIDGIKGNWTDATLDVVDTMYGAFPWKRSLTLSILVRHEVHHRGQMTVLMRQAGLTVPGVYGPAKEEWSGMGMNPPEV